MSDQVSGILLAGGKSKRMGQDKRFIEFESDNLLDIAVSRLRNVTEEIVLVTAGVEDLGVDNILAVQDIRPGMGPLMGIYSGLLGMSHEIAVVNPVDTPNMTEELLLYMISFSSSYDVVMPTRAGRLEPLVACYSKNVIPVIDRMLQHGLKPAPHLLADGRSGLKVKLLEQSELRKFGEPDVLFKNINSPDDLLN